VKLVGRSETGLSFAIITSTSARTLFIASWALYVVANVWLPVPIARSVLGSSTEKLSTPPDFDISTVRLLGILLLSGFHWTRTGLRGIIEETWEVPMKLIVFLFSILLSFQCFADDPEPVGVYCFSGALEAGFKDIDANFYCVQLGKRGEKKKSLAIVESRGEADLVTEFLGAEQFKSRGEATYLNYGIAFTPDLTKNREAAIISVGGFSKAFSSEGINASAAMGLVRQVEEWIRENRETILDKAKKK
jgi:hypothetical protein